MASELPEGFESSHPTNLFYRGSGIPAKDHLQDGIFDFDCPACKTIESVIVLSSEWGVSLQNGDASGKFTARCDHCGEIFYGRFED
ncbi:MAG: phage FluMu protein Com [bacterium]|jgi:phage FluMu protein Com